MVKRSHPLRVARAKARFLVEGWDPRTAKNLAPWCGFPISRTLSSHHFEDMPLRLASGRRHYMDIEVACRRCPGCKKHRQKLWQARAHDEIRLANRTWFGTLTFAPEVQIAGLFEARAYARKRGLGDFDALGRAEQHRILSGIQYPHVQRFFKRLRAGGAKFRYLLVAEEHKSGLPHFHVLLHEKTDTMPKASLEAQWRAGFSHWRLVSGGKRSVWYVCKYLAKDIPTRVWNSHAYGGVRMHDVLAAQLAAQPQEVEPPRLSKAKTKNVEDGTSTELVDTNDS